MMKLMQGASALTLAAVLALGPAAAVAQTAATEGAVGMEAQTDDTTAEGTVILPQDGTTTDTDTAQTDPLVPDAGTDLDTAETDPLVPGTGTDIDTAETDPLAPGVGTDTDTAQSDPLAPGADIGTDTAQIGDDGVVAPVEGTIQMQSQNTVLASDLLGARLYNAADETVGTVDDVIVSTEGMVEGVVIGVGGFLGIGKKQVAVEMDQISVQADASGNPRLLLDSTREALEAAPDFVTAADQARDAERLQMDQVQPTQGVSGAAGDAGTLPATD